MSMEIIYIETLVLFMQNKNNNNVHRWTHMAFMWTFEKDYIIYYNYV